LTSPRKRNKTVNRKRRGATPWCFHAFLSEGLILGARSHGRNRLRPGPAELERESSAGMATSPHDSCTATPPRRRRAERTKQTVHALKQTRSPLLVGAARAPAQDVRCPPCLALAAAPRHESPSVPSRSITSPSPPSRRETSDSRPPAAQHQHQHVALALALEASHSRLPPFVTIETASTTCFRVDCLAVWERLVGCGKDGEATMRRVEGR
jgi:hypothetical protein